MAVSIRLLLVLTLFLGSVPVLAGVEVAQASVTVVEVTPTNGEVGTEVTIEGSGFGRPRGTVRFGDTEVVSFKPSRAGTFSVSFVVPPAAAGSTPVTAQNAAGTASAPFTVTVPTPSESEPTDPEPTDPEPTDPEPRRPTRTRRRATRRRATRSVTCSARPRPSVSRCRATVPRMPSSPR